MTATTAVAGTTGTDYIERNAKKWQLRGEREREGL